MKRAVVKLFNGLVAGNLVMISGGVDDEVYVFNAYKSNGDE